MDIEILDDNPIFEILSWVIRAASTNPEHGAALKMLRVEENRIYATNKHQVHIYSGLLWGWTPGLYRIRTGEYIGGKGVQLHVTLELDDLDPSTFPKVDNVAPDISNATQAPLVVVGNDTQRASIAYAKIVKAMRPEQALDMDYFKSTFEGINFEDCFIPGDDTPANTPLVFMSGFEYYALISPMVYK